VQGPYKSGSIGSPVPPSEGDWEGGRLVRGGRYRVTKSFQDADGDEHPIGEDWTFVSTLFSKFDDELTLCIRDAGGNERKIPLKWKVDSQQDVLANWQGYFATR
jgi:hypothetical protein